MRRPPPTRRAWQLLSLASWLFVAVMLLTLFGCRLSELLGPLPDMVRVCTSWTFVTFEGSDGRRITRRACREYGWTRAVDFDPDDYEPPEATA